MSNWFLYRIETTDRQAPAGTTRTRRCRAAGLSVGSTGLAFQAALKDFSAIRLSVEERSENEFLSTPSWPVATTWSISEGSSSALLNSRVLLTDSRVRSADRRCRPEAARDSLHAWP